jgi:hypothetical protein
MSRMWELVGSTASSMVFATDETSARFMPRLWIDRVTRNTDTDSGLLRRLGSDGKLSLYKAQLLFHDK